MSMVDDFNEAVELWFKLIEKDDNAKSLELNGWDMERINNGIKQSMELDESLITTFLLLSAFSKQYFDQRVVNINDLTDDPDGVAEYLKQVKRFNELIHSEEMIEIGGDFQESTKNAMAHYGMDNELMRECVSNKHTLAYLRRDALKSMENIRVDQFLIGEQEPVGTHPKYHQNIYGYWNINSLIDHACQMESGVSLNLIRDPDELHSYFCFVIRNGGNLIVLSDVPEYAHPLGRYMSRRPDRALDTRISKNWFPYDLLSLAVNEKGDIYHDKYRESKEKGVVPHQPGHFTLTKLKDIEPCEAIWTTFMFDLIAEKYWKKEIEPLPLSYTGEMIKLTADNTLLASAAKSRLAITPYEPLALPELSINDLTTENVGEEAVGEKNSDSFGKLQWMEDRYKDRVNPALLNLVGTNNEETVFTMLTDVSDTKNRDGKAVMPVEDSVFRMQDEDMRSWLFWNRDDLKGFEKLHPMDGTSFGTRERLDADRRFLSRHNYVKGLQQLADQEYEERKDDVNKWYIDRVEKNMDQLLKYAAADRVDHIRPSRGFASRSDRSHTNFAYVCDNKDYDRQPWNPPVRRPENWDHRGKPICYLNDTASTWALVFRPKCFRDLMVICDCTREELPDVLRNLNTMDYYTGNSILTRIDPIEWALSDPWEDHKFDIIINLSKRARNKIQKENTAPEPMDYTKEPLI